MTFKKITTLLFTFAIAVTNSGCAIFRATGDSVEAVGDGAGEAVSRTGKAIHRAADETSAAVR